MRSLARKDVVQDGAIGIEQSSRKTNSARGACLSEVVTVPSPQLRDPPAEDLGGLGEEREMSSKERPAHVRQTANEVDLAVPAAKRRRCFAFNPGPGDEIDTCRGPRTGLSRLRHRGAVSGHVSNIKLSSAIQQQ